MKLGIIPACSGDIANGIIIAIVSRSASTSVCVCCAFERGPATAETRVIVLGEVKDWLD